MIEWNKINEVMKLNEWINEWIETLWLFMIFGDPSAGRVPGGGGSYLKNGTKHKEGTPK